MARRRREGKEPDVGFEVPDFDEKEFIRKETISFRTTLILFLYSVITALVSFLIWVFTDHSWLLSLVIGLGLGVALKFIFPALKVDISHFQRKEWTGTGFLYFFSWLAFFIFFTNPPIYDGVAPTLEIHITPDAQEAGGAVNVTVIAYDNVRIDPATMQIEVTGQSGPLASSDDFTHLRHAGAWGWSLTIDTPGTYTVTASVADTPTGILQAGAQTRETEATFRVGDVLDVVMSNSDAGGIGHLRGPRDTVTVTFPADVDTYRVWLQPTNDSSEEGRIWLAFDDENSDDDTEVWFAEPDFKGFTAGNNTFRVHVMEHDNYLLAERYEIATIDATLVSTETYSLTVDEGLVGDEVPKLPRQREAFPQQTPGPELALVVVGVVGAALFVARRRD